ncbi:MAG: SDR family oxidoreductase [Oxalobacter sp.]|jgi:NAD(P)-dependent dehydrogenase (short-subunit alcohol dehydrogenase family)|nr:MAG: SDR family oxidoreductase [Oxalobacter sp.]
MTTKQPSDEPSNPQRVALVTGAAKRIGREIALALARRGWDIAVHYRLSANEANDVVKAIEAIGQRALALHCDFADEASVKRLLSEAAAKLGAVSCVVNNAAIFEHDSVEQFSYASLDMHMRTNLGAPILLTHALHQATPEGSQSVVVNLLDQKLVNLNPSFLSYTLSKAAFDTVTVMLAQELAPKLRVVGVSPGITLKSSDMTDQEFAMAHVATPLGKSSTPQDIAAAVCFLIESPAITGTTLTVDGGQHLIPTRQDIMFLVKAPDQTRKP